MSAAVDRRSRTRVVVSVIVQSLISAAVILIIYYLVPSSASIAVRWGCAILFLGVASIELRGVVKDPQPVGRAVVAMARILPLFIVLFAWLYVATSANDPATFSEPLTKSGSLYFTVTVFSTVGFGDITPVTDTARLIVSVQMIGDLVVIGILVKLITGVAKQRAQQMTSGIEGTPTKPKTDRSS